MLFKNLLSIQRIIKTFALVQSVTWPTLMIWHMFLYVNASIQIIPPAWMSHVVFATRLISTLNSDYVGFNSLIIAVCRYTFIVFKSHAETVGVKRLRTLFIASTIGVPTVRTLLYISTNPVDSRFLSEFVYGDDEIAENFSVNFTHTERYPKGIISDSILYVLVNENLPSILISAIKFSNFTMLILIYSNIIEGLIYWHTFLYSRR